LLDPVSILKTPKNAINNILYPQWSENHNITIPAKNSKPLTEHDNFIG
jgi:hypothetical protein